MRADLELLLAWARRTLQDPRDVARRVLALNLPLQTASLALAAVALLTALVTAPVSMLAANAGAEGLSHLTPLQWGIVQLAGMFVGAALIAYAGQWFGGTGDLAGAIALLAWAEFIILIVQIIQIIALFILPPLTPLLAIVGVALTFWLLVNFIAELHGFPSLIKVFFGIIGVSFVLVFILATLMAVVFGVSAV